MSNKTCPHCGSKKFSKAVIHKLSPSIVKFVCGTYVTDKSDSVRGEDCYESQIKKDSIRTLMLLKKIAEMQDVIYELRMSKVKLK